MDIQKHIDYWSKSADRDLKVADDLFNIGYYNYCLFLGHLALEKVLKGLYTKTLNSIPPKTHNLIFLAEKTDLRLSEEYSDFLLEANAFNIETRYSDYKSDFYKKCTKEFAAENLTKLKEVYFWIKKEL